MAEVSVCVRCSQPVVLGAEILRGVRYHVGHVDERLDHTCGTWGFRTEGDQGPCLVCGAYDGDHDPGCMAA